MEVPKARLPSFDIKSLQVLERIAAELLADANSGRVIESVKGYISTARANGQGADVILEGLGKSEYGSNISALFRKFIKNIEQNEDIKIPEGVDREAYIAQYFRNKFFRGILEGDDATAFEALLKKPEGNLNVAALADKVAARLGEETPPAAVAPDRQLVPAPQDAPTPFAVPVHNAPVVKVKPASPGGETKGQKKQEGSIIDAEFDDITPPPPETPKDPPPAAGGGGGPPNDPKLHAAIRGFFDGSETRLAGTRNDLRRNLADFETLLIDNGKISNNAENLVDYDKIVEAIKNQQPITSHDYDLFSAEQLKAYDAHQADIAAKKERTAAEEAAKAAEQKRELDIAAIGKLSGDIAKYQQFATFPDYQKYLSNIHDYLANNSLVSLKVEGREALTEVKDIETAIKDGRVINDSEWDIFQKHHTKGYDAYQANELLHNVLNYKESKDAETYALNLNNLEAALNERGRMGPRKIGESSERSIDDIQYAILSGEESIPRADWDKYKKHHQGNFDESFKARTADADAAVKAAADLANARELHGLMDRLGKYDEVENLAAYQQRLDALDAHLTRNHRIQETIDGHTNSTDVNEITARINGGKAPITFAEWKTFRDHHEGEYDNYLKDTQGKVTIDENRRLQEQLDVNIQQRMLALNTVYKTRGNLTDTLEFFQEFRTELKDRGILSDKLNRKDFLEPRNIEIEIRGRRPISETELERLAEFYARISGESLDSVKGGLANPGLGYTQGRASSLAVVADVATKIMSQVQSGKKRYPSHVTKLEYEKGVRPNEVRSIFAKAADHPVLTPLMAAGGAALAFAVSGGYQMITNSTELGLAGKYASEVWVTGLPENQDQSAYFVLTRFQGNPEIFAQFMKKQFGFDSAGYQLPSPNAGADDGWLSTFSNWVGLDSTPKGAPDSNADNKLAKRNYFLEAARVLVSKDPDLPLTPGLSQSLSAAYQYAAIGFMGMDGQAIGTRAGLKAALAQYDAKVAAAGQTELSADYLRSMTRAAAESHGRRTTAAPQADTSSSTIDATTLQKKFKLLSNSTVYRLDPKTVTEIKDGIMKIAGKDSDQGALDTPNEFREAAQWIVTLSKDKKITEPQASQLRALFGLSPN